MSDLFEAIRKNNFDLVISFDSSELNVKHENHCICGCIDHPKPLETLFTGPQFSGDPGQARLDLIDRLFTHGWLKPDVIGDDDLFEILRSHSGWEYNDKLLSLLLKHIPKERWVKLRSKDGSTVLHGIVYGHLSSEKEAYYIKLFIAMGCDPTIKNTSSSIFLPLAYRASADMMEMLLDKYGMDVNEEFPEDKEYPQYDDRDNPLLGIFRRFATMKDVKKLQEIKRAVKILIDHGLKLDYVIPSLPEGTKGQRTGVGCCAFDYMVKYGWTEFLADTLQKPSGKIHVAKKVAISERWDRFERKRDDLITQLKDNGGGGYLKYDEKDLQKMQTLLDLVFVNRLAKDESTIQKVTQEVVAVFKAVDPSFLKGVHDTLHNDYDCLEGFLYLDEVEKAYQEIIATIKDE